MPLFRKQMGTLEESLKTTVIVKNIEELKKVIWNDWKIWINPEREESSIFNHKFKIKIVPLPSGLNFDYRCGWYTQHVTANILKKDEFNVVGFVSEPMDE